MTLAYAICAVLSAIITWALALCAARQFADKEPTSRVVGVGLVVVMAAITAMLTYGALTQ